LQKKLEEFEHNTAKLKSLISKRELEVDQLKEEKVVTITNFNKIKIHNENLENMVKNDLKQLEMRIEQ